MTATLTPPITANPDRTCDCELPWDQQQLATLKFGRGTPTPLASTDPCAAADQQMAYHGTRRTTDWTPTVSGWKTVTTAGNATLTLRRNDSGYHCTGCHTNWSSYSVATLHAKHIGAPCHDPATIRDLRTGQPLLTQRSGIWYQRTLTADPPTCPNPAPHGMPTHTAPKPTQPTAQAAANTARPNTPGFPHRHLPPPDGATFPAAPQTRRQAVPNPSGPATLHTLMTTPAGPTQPPRDITGPPDEYILAGTWIIAKTPTTQPYPCRCHERRYSKCHPRYCPCAGRTDTDHLPDGCCAVQKEQQ